MCIKEVVYSLQKRGKIIENVINNGIIISIDNNFSFLFNTFFLLNYLGFYCYQVFYLLKFFSFLFVKAFRFFFA